VKADNFLVKAVKFQMKAVKLQVKAVKFQVKAVKSADCYVTLQVKRKNFQAFL